MPEDGSFEPRSQIALHERVATVETKINGLKDDTTVMRGALHGIHGEMQKYVLLEQRCVDALSKIAVQTEGLPVFVEQFNARRPHIDELITRGAQRDGAWKSWVVAGSVTLSVLSLLIALAGALGTWLSELHHIGH